MTGSGFCLLQSVNVPFVMYGDTRYSCAWSSNIPRRGNIKSCASDRHARASRQKSVLWASYQTSLYWGDILAKNAPTWTLYSTFIATCCPSWCPFNTRPKPPKPTVSESSILISVMNNDLGRVFVFDISLNISLLAFRLAFWIPEFDRQSLRSSFQWVRHGTKKKTKTKTHTYI